MGRRVQGPFVPGMSVPGTGEVRGPRAHRVPMLLKVQRNMQRLVMVDLLSSACLTI